MNEMEQRKDREEIMGCVIVNIFRRLSFFCCFGLFCNAFILTYSTSFFFGVTVHDTPFCVRAQTYDNDVHFYCVEMER